VSLVGYQRFSRSACAGGLLAVAAAALTVACADRRKPIVIGLALSVQEQGVAPMVRGAHLAAEELNARGGVTGRQLVLLEHDDYANDDSAMHVATRLYASEAVAVVGNAYSSVTLASAPIYNGGPHPLVQLSPSASNPAISEAGPYTFRVCATDLSYGAALARWVHDSLGLIRGAVLYVNDAYGRGVRRAFTDEFMRIGGQRLEFDPFLVDRPDVRPYLERLAKEKRAQFIVLAANLAEGTPVLRQVREANLSLPIMASDGFDGIESQGTLAEGVYISTGYLAGTATPANQRFVVAYRRRFPDAGLPDQGAAASYDAVYLIASSIARGGADRLRLRDALSEVGTRVPAYDGVVGRLAFDPNGDVPDIPVQIGIVRAGELVPAYPP
jgi:branched-chain amino acid transport system substrate-binding protein